MTIKEILKTYNDIEVELLLEHVLNKPKEFLYTNPEKKLTTAQLSKLKAAVAKRRRGLPIAYILGYKYFYNRKFIVTKHTLIPRPETELLIDLVAIDVAKQTKPQLLDVGTGGGCIAITLSLMFPQARVSAVDISTAALSVAKKNTRLNHARVNFKKSNLLSGVKNQFEAIIANLPYVPKKIYQKNKDLKYEPKSALVSPKRDDYLILTLIEQSPSRLSSHGKLYLEIDPSMEKAIQKKSKRMGLEVSFYKDIKGLVRFAVLERQP